MDHPADRVTPRGWTPMPARPRERGDPGAAGGHGPRLPCPGRRGGRERDGVGAFALPGLGAVADGVLVPGVVAGEPVLEALQAAGGVAACGGLREREEGFGGEAVSE